MITRAYKILVTGGAGYIGSHLVRELLNAGHTLLVFDDLSSGFADSIPINVTLVRGNILDFDLLNTTFSQFNPDLVFHLAGLLNVAESFEKVNQYFDVNVIGTKNVIAACKINKISRLIFSSSCTVYGNQNSNFCHEDLIPTPVSPYGESKLQCEEIIRTDKSINAVILRLFNVVGAAISGELGQRTRHASQLVHSGVRAAVGKSNTLAIWGDDYRTSDGTCIRDYIHVEDVTRCFISAIDYLSLGGETQIFNCGTGVGHSVKKVIETIKLISKKPFEVIVKVRRSGDPAALISDNSKVKTLLEWQPQHLDLESICRTAMNWELKI